MLDPLFLTYHSHFGLARHRFYRYLTAAEVCFVYSVTSTNLICIKDAPERVVPGIIAEGFLTFPWRFMLTSLSVSET